MNRAGRRGRQRCRANLHSSQSDEAERSKVRATKVEGSAICENAKQAYSASTARRGLRRRGSRAERAGVARRGPSRILQRKGAKHESEHAMRSNRNGRTESPNTNQALTEEKTTRESRTQKLVCLKWVSNPRTRGFTWKVPAEQGSEFGAPGTLVKVPSGLSLHEVCDCSGWNWPAGHSVHADCSETGNKEEVRER